MALEIKSTPEFVSLSFLTLYFCLGYQITEDLIQYRYLKKTNFGSQKMEYIFEMTDKIALIFFLGILNLRYFRVIGESFVLLTPLAFLLEASFYWRNSLTSQSQNIITRLFYIFQSALIAAKMNNYLDLEWKTTLVLVWIYLGINAAYAILAGLLLTSVSLSSIINYDREYLLQLKSEIVGYIWHISYNAFNVVGIILLIGRFGDADELVHKGLLFAKKLSIFLLAYTVLLFPLLKKQTLDLFQDLLTILQVQITHDEKTLPKKHALVKAQEENKKEFFMMISQTYFSLRKEEEMKEKITNKEQTPADAISLSINNIDENQLNISQDKKENMCYICESTVSNAILIDCGHGGVCCDCAVKSVEQKNECMECRKPVKSIYKIENNEGENIVQASEFVQVIEV